MKKHTISILLALILSIVVLPSFARAASGDVAAKSARGNGHPYYIMVNRIQNTVTVYGLDENGYYTVPIRAMICSAGTPEHFTPTGSFSIGIQYDWHLMMGGVYAQYVSQFSGACMFHSVCYSRPNPAALLPEYYNRLGELASHGCIRLQTVDAKWIYDNCGRGTLVTVYDGDEPGELGKPARAVDQITAENYNGWDPTDPREENPWRLSAAAPVAEPAETAETVETVEEDSGLPFRDVSRSAWYYNEVRSLYEEGILAGDNKAFAPASSLTNAQAIQMLYNLAGRPAVETEGGTWYAPALAWAGAFELYDGADPDGEMTRGDLIELLYRYEMGAAAAKPVAATESAGSALVLADAGGDAMNWAVSCRLLFGDGSGSLHADSVVTRDQGAVILYRYCEAGASIV